MDEKDFAELISVFLKGNEQEETSGDKETKGAGAAQDEKQASSEADIRKNIIEALAEKIKESSDVQVAEETLVEDADEKPSLAQDTTQATTQDLIDEIPSFEDAIEELVTHIPEDTTIEEELVTKEEVDTLLNDTPATTPAVHQVLNYFTELDGVQSALIVTRDGFTVDHVSNTRLELDMVSAVVATGFNIMDKIGRELDQGELRIAMLEYGSGPVVVSPLSQDIALVIVASEWTTLGRIRWEIKKQLDALLASL